MAFLVDTDIIIDMARGREAAVEYMEQLPGDWSISIVTAMEVVVGARDNRELAKTEKFLAAIQVVPVSPGVGTAAYELLKRFARSHGLRILDAVIASTAI